MTFIHRASDARFRSEVDSTMSQAIGLNKDTVSDALKQISLRSLSKTERTAFLTTLKQLAGDGHVSKQDAAVLTQMLNSFANNGKNYHLFFQGSIEHNAVNTGRFSNEMHSTLDRTGGFNAALVECALNSVNCSSLSVQERSSLLTTLRSFSQDGAINSQEAKTLIDMIHEFDDKGIHILPHFWPYKHIDLSNSPGNPFMTTAQGIAAGGCIPPPWQSVPPLETQLPLPPGGGFPPSLPPVLTFPGDLGPLQPAPNGNGGFFPPYLQVQCYKHSIENMLNNCPETFGRDALLGAFRNADLSNLTPSEMRELNMMVSVATCDGHINTQEARAIYNALQSAQKPEIHLPLPPWPCPAPSSNWQVEQKGGKADIDLGNYVLSLNEQNSEITLLNKITGEKSKVWGDPHFDLNGDGKDDVNFKGTISLNLADGIKITINTKPNPENNNVTFASSLTITHGDDAIVVNGLDQLTTGDLSIQQSKNGAILDAFTSDGLNLYENNRGAGWQVQDGFWMRPVTQSDMDKSDASNTDYSISAGLQIMLTQSVFASSDLSGRLNSMFKTQ